MINSFKWKLTFHALTFGNGASTNFTEFSDGAVVALAPLDDAFESSAEEFAFSLAADLLGAELLSPVK